MSTQEEKGCTFPSEPGKPGCRGTPLCEICKQCERHCPGHTGAGWLSATERVKNAFGSKNG